MKKGLKVALICDNVHRVTVATPKSHFDHDLPLPVKYEVEQEEFTAMI